MEKKTRKIAIVLGGSSGIGKATAQRFAKEGWLVVIASPDLHQLECVRNTLDGEGHLSVELDVRNDAHYLNLTRQLQAQGIHHFDALVNSIGISEHFDVLDKDFNAWNNALEIMLYGTVRSCRTLVPLMRDGGRIIQITSIHYSRVEKGSSAYGMAKAAITQFTRSLALELAPRNILANTIAPGFIDTPMSVKNNGENELNTTWFHDNYIKYGHLPLKRAGHAKEIAGVAYFLAGPDASYITGSVITVDGGLTITF